MKVLEMSEKSSPDLQAQTNKNAEKDSKIDRKKQALRDNLKRRKSQIREFGKDAPGDTGNRPNIRNTGFSVKSGD